MLLCSQNPVLLATELSVSVIIFTVEAKSVSNIAFIQDLLIIHSRLLTSNVMVIRSF